MDRDFLRQDPVPSVNVPSGSRSTPLPRSHAAPRPTKQHLDDTNAIQSPPLSLACDNGNVHLKEQVMSPTRMPRVDVLRERRVHQTFQFAGTPGGRLKAHRVGFAEYGDIDTGHPAFIIGGHGCSRLVGVMFDNMARRHHIRTIWPERPGYGLSEECSAQDISAMEWAEVVIQLADHLEIRRFSIIAQSVGAVFAMAIAHKYPARVVGPLFLISPWVSTQASNTFKWSRRLPAMLVTRTVSLAMDVMWMLNKTAPTPVTASASSTPSTTSTSASDEDASNSTFSNPSSPRLNEHSQLPAFHNPDHLPSMTLEEEDELLASFDDDEFDHPTDFPPHRPLRHAVRPKNMSLYFAMNKLRMTEPYTQGQTLDVLVALEKYHSFGFNYSEIKTAVTAVWGDKDGLIPIRAVEVLANGLRDVRFKILEGEGHDLVWKEGVMEWAIRGVAERWRVRTERLTMTMMNKMMRAQS